MKKINGHIIALINNFLQKFGIKEQTRTAFVKYFFNTGWMFAEKVFTLFVAFVVGIYVARYLGPEKYGLLNFSISWVFIFQVFSKLGLDGIVTRNLVLQSQKKKQLLGTSFILKLSASVISFLMILVSVFYIDDAESRIMIIVIAGGMLFNCFDVGRFYFEANVKAKYSSMAVSISVFIGALLKVYLLIIQADLLWFAVVYAVEIVIRGSAFLIFYNLKNRDIIHWKYDKQTAKLLLKDAWPLMISSAAVMLFMRIDQVMINEMINAEATGFYSAAIKISELWYFIPVAINNSLFPAIIEAKKNGTVFYHKRLRQLFGLLILIALLITVPVAFFSKQIVLNLFGNDYFPAIKVLQIHIWSAVFIFMNNAVAKWHIAENFTKLSLLRTSSGAVLNITLNLFLIPLYGINGAAWATLISYAFVGYFGNLMYKPGRKLFKIQTEAIFFKSIIGKRRR